jgi:hypothetical protein
VKIAQGRPAQTIALCAYTADRPGAVPERSYVAADQWQRPFMRP